MDNSLFSSLKPQQVLEGLEGRERLRYLRLSVKHCRKERNNIVSELVRELEIVFKQELTLLFYQLYKQVLRKRNACSKLHIH